jgi:CheY-like chemotaxis protein/tRNA A-37 threonylcarbamoyl transferase component Bud32
MRILRQRYAIEREIDRGAAGGIWVARDLQLGRQVAVKLVHQDRLESAEARAYFEREARTLAQLKSPNVVQVFDYGVDEHQPFIVMELLDGENLESRLQRRSPRPLPMFLVADVVLAIAKGLTIIHRAGVVHRDLKPANVYLAREHGGEVVKLVDFGIATLSRSARADADADCAAFAGTPSYMSPEQFDSQQLDATADLWALGVLVYRMLTGIHPFAGGTLQDLRRQIREGEFTAPSTLVAELGADVDSFFIRAFAKIPDERFASAVEFATGFMKLSSGAEPAATRVLFVDDEPDMRGLLELRFRKQIRERRYEFFFAADGDAALQELREHPDIGVVLTDINMPRLDGLAFLGRVPDVDAHVRVVVVSAYSDMINIRTAMNRGAFDFLCKPIDFGDLERTIDRAAAQTAALRKAWRLAEEHNLAWAQDCAEPAGIDVFEGTAAFVELRGIGELVTVEGGHSAFGLSLELLRLILPELTLNGGMVAHLTPTSAMAVFSGKDHLTRAIDACLAARDGVKAKVSGNGLLLARASVCAALSSGILATSRMAIPGLRREPVFVGAPLDTAARLLALCDASELVLPAEYGAELSTHYDFRTVTAPESDAIRLTGRRRKRLLGDDFSNGHLVVPEDTVALPSN